MSAPFWETTTYGPRVDASGPRSVRGISGHDSYPSCRRFTGSRKISPPPLRDGSLIPVRRHAGSNVLHRHASQCVGVEFSRSSNPYERWPARCCNHRKVFISNSFGGFGGGGEGSGGFGGGDADPGAEEAAEVAADLRGSGRCGGHRLGQALGQFGEVGNDVADLRRRRREPTGLRALGTELADAGRRDREQRPASLDGRRPFHEARDLVLDRGVGMIDVVREVRARAAHRLERRDQVPQVPVHRLTGRHRVVDLG